jgi:NAD(P)-dependent dehydrogenase (short-subunit alcohol dehydrogenase family)
LADPPQRLHSKGQLAPGFRFRKIALVTGGTSGIGLATAKKFVAEGAYVFITGRRRANLDEAVKTIGQTNVTAINGIVGNLSDLDVLFEAIRTKKGVF